MKTILTLATLAALCALAHADTTITIGTNVVTPTVKHFGMDLAQINYYDSGQVLKEHIHNNPGFEGILYQSIVPIGSGTATNAVENGPWTQWASGFWAGADYEFVYGNTIKGRQGTLLNNINPRDPAGNTNGTVYIFSGSNPPPVMGDWMILRKSVLGGGAGSAITGWWTSFMGNGSITSETNDLPPPPAGKQCARLTAPATGDQATLIANFDTWQGANFVRLKGQYQLTYRAKGLAANSPMLVNFRRGSGTYNLSQIISLPTNWVNYTNTFSCNETGVISGPCSLQFSVSQGSAALLDDVSLRATGGDPSNPTVFRDEVVAALRALNPGFIRYPNWQFLGDTVENELAPKFERVRAAYGTYSTNQNLISLGLHDFLVLCETLHADPWMMVSPMASKSEITNLMAYLGGGTNMAYGKRRHELGHPLPWTSVFNTIHIEYGNENWNPVYRGAALSDPPALGAHASEIFGVAKSSPYYQRAKFNFILGEQTVVPWRGIHTHDAGTNHDMMCFAPYMGNRLNNFANNEEMFSPLFAEPEWWNKPNGFMYQQYTNIQASSRPVPLAIYEISINDPVSTNSALTQAELNALVPSVGSALAVADNMLKMLRELHIRDQGFMCFGGYHAQRVDHLYSPIWGAVVDVGVTDRKRPHYYALQLANTALAGDLLATTHSGDNPTWNVNNLNSISYTNAHFIQSYAFSKGSNHSLVIFNLHRTNSLAVNFAGTNPPSGNVMLRRLTSVNITDNNETAPVVAPTAQVVTNFNPAAGISLPPFSMTVLQWPLPEPRLKIENVGNASLVSWPASAPAFPLETAPNISGPWTPAPHSVLETATERVVTVTNQAAPQAFFRLNPN